EDLVFKANLYDELSEILSAFLNKSQNKMNDDPKQNENHIMNSISTKHKTHPPKRLKSVIEQDSNKHNYALKDKSSNIINNDTSSDSKLIGDSKGYKCEKYKQLGHYTKTCTRE
ncbi:1098_t:CDS:1, partial [Scutellospora calospora]